MNCLIFFVNPYLSEQEHNQKCKYIVDVTITIVDQLVEFHVDINGGIATDSFCSSTPGAESVLIG